MAAKKHPGRSWKKGESGNPLGRPKFELVDAKTGEVIKKSEYAIRWHRRFRSRLEAAATRVLPKLVEIAMASDNDTARVAAIKEIFNRTLGMARQQVDIRGDIAVNHSYVDFLRQLQERVTTVAVTTVPPLPELPKEQPASAELGAAIPSDAVDAIDADFVEAPVSGPTEKS